MKFCCNTNPEVVRFRALIGALILMWCKRFQFNLFCDTITLVI